MSIAINEIPARDAGRARWLNVRPTLNTEQLILCASLFFTLFCNGPFWSHATEGHAGNVLLALSLFLLLFAVNGLILGLLVFRWNAKPLLTVLFVATAFATHYMTRYNLYFDTNMVRNVLATDFKESTELLSLDTHLLTSLLLYAVLPITLLWRVRLRPRPWSRTLLMRGGLFAAMLLMAVVGAGLSFQNLSSLFRNHREVRYLATPANYLVGLSKALQSDTPGTRAPKLPLGTDASLLARPDGARPRLLVLVVGETARAQNWGLNGYARQTTPELADMADVINFSQTTSCGTSTEVSLPCMFSALGRRNYNENEIRRHQSLMHVLEHAGINTLWRDNQSGCKGVCEGLAYEAFQGNENPELCNGKRCFDGVMLDGLMDKVRAKPGDRVVVLHQLGNHGPTYYERYPAQFRRFTPTCDIADLGGCEQQQIVNAYDNALLYTDHLLASTINLLRRQEDYDTALIYVSDHGESLGEKGLFLHGVPYAIAPREQTQVPMLMWFSPEFVRDRGLDTACLRQRAQQPAHHDNLFPSVLGLMQVRTEVYDRSQDLFADCET